MDLRSINWEIYPMLKSLNISNTKIVSLEGCPSTIEELNCSKNKLGTLKWCPDGVLDLKCNDCGLTSFEFCPDSVDVMSCSKNNIKNFDFCPKRMKVLKCDNNAITNFKNIPRDAHIIARDNPISSLKYFPIWDQRLSISPSEELMKTYGLRGDDVEKAITVEKNIRRRVYLIQILNRACFYKDLIKLIVKFIKLDDFTNPSDEIDDSYNLPDWILKLN